MILEKDEDILNFLNGDYVKVVLSNKRKKTSETQKVNVNKILVKDQIVYQFSIFIGKQVFHENLNVKEVANKRIIELFNEHFNQINIFEKQSSIELKRSKKGKIIVNKRALEENICDNLSHNKEKNYILKPELKIEPLIDLGVITKDGQIVNKEYSKFKQINKFIEIIDNSFDEFDKKELNILDFGCGKSYLTFIIYYYFNFIKKIKTHIVGLDLKEDVIDKCNLIAEKYGYSDLEFIVGDIADYKQDRKFDIMVSLHACDVATDFAIFNAIKWDIKHIFSVPCCHHEIAHQINKSLDYVTKYSILKDRFSSILTDSIRANILETFGYKVNICEFIDFEETPKNILIKATKVRKSINQEKFNEVGKILREFGCEQTLYSKAKQLIENGEK